MRSGLTSQPEVSPGVRYPDNLRDAKLLQFVLVQALTIDLPPPAPANAKGEYIDLIGFSGEDTGIGTYNYLAFRVFGVNVPALTYLYFVIVTASLMLYGAGHWRSVGAMAAVVAVTLALYVVVCADFVNFLGSSAFFNSAGIDVKDPRFLGTIAAIPVLHLIVMATRPRYRLGPLDYIVVAMQAAIFAFALQIRSPVIWAVLALSAFWLMVGVLALRRFSSTSRRELGDRNSSSLAGFLAACRSGTRSCRLRRSYSWFFGGVECGRAGDAAADGRRDSVFYCRRLAAELAGDPQPDGHDRQFRLDCRFLVLSVVIAAAAAIRFAGGAKRRSAMAAGRG
jgi:hypothetical protein